MIVTRSDGSRWKLGAASRTSDGFAIASGTLVDENDNVVRDGDGFPVVHSFFLGRA